MDLLSLDLRVVLSQKVLNLRLLKRCLGIKELGNSCQKLIEGFDEGGLCWDGNSGETVLEVREDIGSGVGINYFDEEGVGLDAVIEAVQVDEMNGFSLVILQFCHPKGP